MVEKLNPIIDRCFKSEKGRKPDLRKIKPNTDLAIAHLKKAHSNLKAMKLMYKNDFFDWAVISGYYALYHSVLASLCYIGIRAFSHVCAIAAFQRFYVKRGKISDEYVVYLKRAKQLEKKCTYTLREARESRVKVQYGTQILSNEDAEDFVLKIEELMAQ